MSIAKRLLVLLLTSLATLLLLAGVNYNQMGRVFDAANFSNENVIPSILVLDKGLRAFGEVRIRLYRHVLNTDPKSMAEIEKSWQEAVGRVEQSLKEYEPLVAGEEDRRLLTEERASFVKYLEGARKVLALSSQNRNEEALKALNDNAAEARHFNDALQAHMHFNEKLAQTSAAEAVSMRKSAVLISIVVIIAALLVVGGLSLQIRSSITTRLQQANQMAEQIAAGDLSQHGQVKAGTDEIGALMQSMEKMRSDLARTIGQISSNTQTLVSSAAHLASAAQQVSVGSEQQSSSTSAAAAAVEELTVSIDHVGSSADDANARAEEAGTAATTSGRNVSAATQQINRVAESVEDTAQRIGQLAEQVQLIGNITTVIREVADQTNLLALNAAIEAARAGEQGRGFAVVADEVRKLAERTTLSVQEISTLIGSIQSGVSGAEESMAASRRTVGEVVEVAENASGSMSGIESATGNAREAISAISYALREQRSTSTELARSVESIAQMAEENSNAAHTVAHTAQELASVSNQLQQAVSRFRT